MKKDGKSIYLSYLLRHGPRSIGLEMDCHGWVYVDQLLSGINNSGGKYKMTFEELQEIVAEDNKGRYRFNDDKSMIKACQGHSVPWVEPELEYMCPPETLYHGTTTAALEEIRKSGAILKMGRHAVHMQEDMNKAWKSAIRWKKNPVILEIRAKDLSETGVVFGVSENQVWCAERIPVEYIGNVLYELPKEE